MIIALVAGWAATTIGLTVCMAWQQFHHMKQVQLLCDKAMAGSFQSYTHTVNPPVRPVAPSEPQDDLRPLNEFLS